MEETKSNMEIAMEFIEAHPSLAEAIQGDGFQVFWEHPTKVIELFNMSLNILNNARQIPQEIVDSMKPDLMNDACISYLDLIPNEAE